MAGRKNKHAYLDDFEKDLNGNYQYRGAHYRYAGTPTRGRALAVLWLCCGGGAALAVGAGVLPGATAHASVWLLLPYMAALITALYAVVVLARLTRGGDPMRAYIHEQTAQKLPTLTRACALFAVLAAAGQGSAVFANGAQMLLGAQGIFILLEIFSACRFCRRCCVFPADALGKRVIFIQLHMRDLKCVPLGGGTHFFLS